MGCESIMRPFSIFPYISYIEKSVPHCEKFSYFLRILVPHVHVRSEGTFRLKNLGIPKILCMSSIFHITNWYCMKLAITNWYCMKLAINLLYCSISLAKSGECSICDLEQCKKYVTSLRTTHFFRCNKCNKKLYLSKSSLIPVYWCIKYV